MDKSKNGKKDQTKKEKFEEMTGISDNVEMLERLIKGIIPKQFPGNPKKKKSQKNAQFIEFMSCS